MRFIKHLLVIIALVTIVGTAHAQSNVAIGLGATYSGGTVTITQVTPSSQPAGTLFVPGFNSLVLDTSGAATITALPQGRTYGFFVCKSTGLLCLYTTTAVTGGAQDITTVLQASTWGASGGGGCTPAGSAGQLLTDSGAGACSSAADFVITSHTLAGGASSITNLSAASATAGFKPPAAAGAAPTTEGISSFNTTSHLPVWGFNGASTVTIPVTQAAVASNWIRSYTQTTGAFTASRPACADISDAGLACSNNASVTSVSQSFTGGLISVAGSPITTSGTLALTVAGTSGGVPYFSGAATWASSGALTANVLIKGGGAGAAPAVSLATDNGTTLTYTGTGGMSSPAFTATGSGAGFLSLVNGSAPSLTANSISLFAPATITTAYGISYPAAENGSAGLVHLAAASSHISALTVSAVVSADLNITTTSCTSPAVVTAISATAVGTCTIIPITQNSQSAAYTTVLGDGGKQIYHPGADTTARTWTIDSNANVAYPIGTVLTFVNDTLGGVITIAITSDTLVLAGAGTTGSRTLAASGIATAIKMTATRWMINGTGLT